MSETEETDTPEERVVELVRYMVSAILGEEISIELETEWEPGELRVALHVPAEHRGRVIGRHGRVARSMRNVLSASRLGVHRPISLDIVD